MRLSQVPWWDGCVVSLMTDIETKIQQIATVLGQLEDTQVPRNIRNSVKDAVDKWLLNESKDMDIRLGMTASMLDEILPVSPLTDRAMPMLSPRPVFSLEKMVSLRRVMLFERGMEELVLHTLN